ncbi:MAG: hypothetical protein LBU44_03890 [Mediterranea sp.]|jgi:hypothetical protein|nr:hypothetical protein [Mediterranea sp.]
MKKKMISFVLAAMTVTSLCAGDINVKSGDVSVVKNPNNLATIQFSYAQTLVEGKPLMEYLKERGDEFVKDWPKESQVCEKAFYRRWNSKNKKGLKLTDNPNVPYRMIITVDKLDLGSFASSFLVGFGAGGARMSGTIEIYEKEKNICLLTLTINNQTGHSAYTEQKRRADLYKELVDDVIEVIKEIKQ